MTDVKRPDCRRWVCVQDLSGGDVVLRRPAQVLNRSGVEAATLKGSGDPASPPTDLYADTLTLEARPEAQVEGTKTEKASQWRHRRQRPPAGVRRQVGNNNGRQSGEELKLRRNLPWQTSEVAARLMWTPAPLR